MGNQVTFQDIIAASIRNRDEHRKEYNDSEWSDYQRLGPPIYMKGDIVEFIVGGIGVIEDVSWHPETGNPPACSAQPIGKHNFHYRAKCAWHYEGDIKRIVRLSAIRSLSGPLFRML